MDEFNFNKSPGEVNPQVENTVILENEIIQENLSIEENQPVPEVVDAPQPSKIKKEKVNTALSSLVGSVGTIIAAAVVGITNLLNVGMNAEFNEVKFQDGEIIYQINVDEMTEKETLTLYLYEDEKLKQSINLVDDDHDGIIDGNIIIPQEEIDEKINNGEVAKYRLTLKGVVGLDVERSFDSYLLKAEIMESRFESIEGHCNCGVDGYYYFTMNFSDDSNIFTDFKSYIVDSFGNQADCIFNEDLHSEQRIFINNLKGSIATLYVTYNANGVSTTEEINITI